MGGGGVPREVEYEVIKLGHMQWRKKTKTFRIATLYRQKLSGQSAKQFLTTSLQKRAFASHDIAKKFKMNVLELNYIRCFD